jgi:hypothetical protein
MRPESRSEPLTHVPSELPLEPVLGTSVRVQPFRFDPTLPVDVRLVRWPMEETYRAELQALALPRILILDCHTVPPPLWDELEDWVRVPADRDELALRAMTVARRADVLDLPWLDADGLLWFRDRWCPVPRGQVPLVRLLVDHFGTVVRDHDVDEVFGQSSASAHAEAIKTSVRRVSRGLAPLGLQLKRVRGSGFLLERRP